MTPVPTLLRFSLACALALITACAPSPTAPSAPIASAAGSLITLTLSPSGVLMSGSTVEITARARTAEGNNAAGQGVEFTTNTGTLSQTTMTTGAGGMATVTLTGREAAYVTATMAGTSQAISIPAQAPYAVSVASAGVVIVNVPALMLVTVTPTAGLASPPAPSAVRVSCGDGAAVLISGASTSCTFPQAGNSMVRASASSANGWSTTGATAVAVTAAFVPPTPPERPPPSPTPGPTLRADLSCTTSSLAVSCNVLNARYGSNVLSSESITEVRWDWGDGDPNTTSAPFASHTYPQAGTYLLQARVTAETIDGRQTVVTSTSITVPKP